MYSCMYTPKSQKNISIPDLREASRFRKAVLHVNLQNMILLSVCFFSGPSETASYNPALLPCKKWWNDLHKAQGRLLGKCQIQGTATLMIKKKIYSSFNLHLINGLKLVLNVIPLYFRISWLRTDLCSLSSPFKRFHISTVMWIN